jgi:CheY-like chemotaxis protein
MVHADPTRLQQAFMNLALNSRDAMPNGGTLRFEISRILVQPGERPPTAYMFPGLWIRISVQDSGEGISTDNLPHIFEPFFTTKPVGQGTGLGLAQVYGIIKQHDGYIDVKSRVGHGTLFTIFLPALSAPKVKDPTAEFRIQLNGEGKHVLVVEDDPATREALLALLEAHHYGVVAATNGIEALGLLQENHKGVDLIISDIVMPLMGGLSLYRTVNELWPEIKMLFITGHPLEGENQKLLEQGHVMWLQKPFSAQNFNKAVYTLLEE